MSGSASSNPPGGGGSSSGGGDPPRRKSSASGIMDPLVGTTVLDRYEILERIGSGGMGAVYVGRQLTVGRKVALKVLRGDLMSNEHVRERFRREAEIIGHLRHPNTIQLIDYGETDAGIAVMVMELLVGEALSDRLKRGPLDLIEALRIAEEVAGSLSEAHHTGMVHRDLKPANIFLVNVAGENHAKVLDFGIARILDEEATRLTSTGQVFGTPRYMSPEQALSTGDVDARSDIYSLGLIVFECVAGQPPFVAQTSIQYLTAHSAQPPPKLREQVPNAPEVLERLVDACLEKDPGARPQTAQAVAQALAAIRRGLESGLVPDLDLSSTVRAPVPLASPDATTKDPTRPSATRPLTHPDIKTSAPSRAPLIVAGGVLAFAVAGVILMFGLGGRVEVLPVAELDGGVARVSPDAGSSGSLAHVIAPVDSGAVDPGPAGLADGGSVLATTAADAGEAVGSVGPDAGRIAVAEGAPPDAGAVRVAENKQTKKKKNRVSQGAGETLGGDVITGPRGLSIEVEDGDSDPVARAAKCSKSVFSGLASLTVKGCPDACAVIVDGQCGGQTPAEARSFPPGEREVAVVCGGKVKKRATLELEAGRDAVVRCP